VSFRRIPLQYLEGLSNCLASLGPASPPKLFFSSLGNSISKEKIRFKASHCKAGKLLRSD
jgi:hypothetical protein